MYTKKMNALRLFLTGTILIGLGIFILNTGIFTLQAMFYIFGIAFLVVGISNILRLFIKKIIGKDTAIHISTALINIAVGIVILLYPQMQISLFGIICGLYALLIGAIRLLNYYILRRNVVTGRLKDLLLGILYIGLGGFLLFSPYLYVDVVLNIIAVYFILYGGTYYNDWISEIIPNTKKDYLKRKIRITMPVFIEFMIPKFVLDEINQFLTPSDEKEIDAIPDFEEIKSDEEPDIEVFVHTSSKGFGMMGHVDICFEGKVISYGNYDTHSQRLFELIGDGVLFFANREEYIPFVIKDSEKTLISFGIKLDEVQKEQVRKRMEEIKANIYKWIPPFYVGRNDYYASRLNYHVPTEFYKFKKGKFKTFFVLGTNCVLLADQIVGSAGIDILKMNGIITPGTYYEYLNKEFGSKNMLVISKQIYN
ncbi:uncharacterized membrane protein HdeD (DUF308 family) [Breznakia sp. PF5-3]|uniref:HdeD family acid-resistance protein n=1 Tax=unclassified Breznakia TaxID=2623764 RepID=UPI00240694A1|nr:MULTISPECIES: DUF308 domain-containing protein [unclassified Breznakia]MDF9825618.1 uncharacterized membrane protein HdeD (DUF308 family) [Breznakia sp. PM6-1]MDF9836439.1 uncharacterized membrane protein HdeD (DUF308 family) [Breznakia sp. PF5-3]MDF9838359.1 uncharacterized membrane protein HdeD (DUF308 family) [Breznakia sp. PFB2-8]MDF9860349.1 uncharacterized membrane protein HdeD (DUF308 family) [Breznakia sp. PH5-24]